MSRLHPPTRLWLLIGLTVLAFGLRLYQLDDVPLRGDEAFAVRYWAAAPQTVIRDLADEEPHPVGTFLVFHTWKVTAGDSEFAMRYLPLLGNLLGLAAVAALAQQLFHDDRVMLLAAGLWAVHPFLIWHAQDVRNYGLWSGVSPLALVLFLRALGTPRPHRGTWVAYVLAQAGAFYSFFLEVFLFPLHLLALFLLRRDRQMRRTIWRVVFAWTVLLILLLPWIVQAYFLSQSGYEGNTEDADAAQLLSWILPTLLVGNTFGAPWDTLLSLAWLALVALGLWNVTRANGRPRHLLWFAAWIVLPPLVLLVAATRMSIFHPRYLIAWVPAIIVLTARALIPPERPTLSPRGIRIGAPLLLGLIPLVALTALPDVYHPATPKAPDWPALATYLEARAQPGDLILQRAPDPAFGYYYHGPADETSLQPGANAAAQLRPQTFFYDTIWLVGREPDAETFLETQMQRVGRHTVADFTITQFRAPSPDADEPQRSTEITFGAPGDDAVATLRGVTVQGPDPVVRTITVLLYWEPLRQTEVDYKVFLHLIGPPQTDGSPLWDQDDHRPQGGTVGTRKWEPGALLRDSYTLLDDPSLALAPGTYTLQVGLYDPDTNTRLPAYDANGNALGDSVTLATLELPLQ